MEKKEQSNVSLESLCHWTEEGERHTDSLDGIPSEAATVGVGENWLVAVLRRFKEE